MAVVSYQAISIGGEKGDNYAIFKKFQFVPFGKAIVICDIKNKHKSPILIKWISYYIQLNIGKKTYQEKFLHLFKKPVYLNDSFLRVKNKTAKLFRSQSIHSIFPNLGKLPHGQKLSAIQFTA